MNKLSIYLQYIPFVMFRDMNGNEFKIDYFYNEPEPYFGFYDRVESEVFIEGIRPVLRPMWTMTESEMKSIGIDFHKFRTEKTYCYTPQQINQMVQLRLDVYGCIELGWAVTSIKP